MLCSCSLRNALLNACLELGDADGAADATRAALEAYARIYPPFQSADEIGLVPGKGMCHFCAI